MDIHIKIVKLITIIQEAGHGLTKEQLLNIALGNSTEDLQNLNLTTLDSFGFAEDTKKEDLDAIIEHALKDGFLKIKNQKQHTLTYTPEGKKFCKKPHLITINSKTGNPSTIGVGDLDSVIHNALMCKNTNETQNVTERSKLQIKLIQAIDRKIALDVFAESENVDLDEVLDELEALLRHGKRMDITYFTDEVIGKEDIEEIRASFDNKKITMEDLCQEWDDVYNEEELRLLFYILS